MVAAKEDERPSWGRHFEFIITCVGFAVGLGNVWRFPHLVYKNGGGAFLIPYVICLVFLGIPLFCLEVLFGQFASQGPLTIWEINPLFKGLGYTMISLTTILTVYYNIVIAYSIYYFFASMQSTLPWVSCGNDWNTCFCRTPNLPLHLDDPLMWYNDTGLDCTGIDPTNKTVSSSEEYFYHKVLEQTTGMQDIGDVKWDITLCNLLAWVIICFALIKGVKSMGKAAYFSALFPYILLTILVIRGATLDGARKGIDFYLTPDSSSLTDSLVWKAAASQIFFSLSCCTGSLTAMASYNKFSANCFRDSIIIPIINCLTSFYAGFAIFSVLGYMSENYGKDVGSVTTSGPGLVFVAYPEAIGEMPVPQLWAILFFFMMICLGMGSQFPGAETILTAFQDEFPVLRKKWNNIIFRISVCAVGFLLGLPQTTQGGFYLFDLCDIFLGFPLLLVGFFEIVAIVWVYGPSRFSEDVMLMMGHSEPNRLIYNCYFKWNWIFITPGLLLAIIIYDAVEYKPITQYSGYYDWSEALGWLIVAFIMMWIPLWYLVGFCIKGGAKLLYNLSQPTLKWGPAEPENRTIYRYKRLLELRERELQQPNEEEDLGHKHAKEDVESQLPATYDNPGFSPESASNSEPPPYDDVGQTQITAL